MPQNRSRRPEMMRRVIFLDIDGVVAPIRQWDRYGDLDAECIKVLNEIVAQSGAAIVVSSTLRHGRTVARLQEMLDAAGFVGVVIDKTPSDLTGASRGDEIAWWLAKNGVDGFVIIDDHGGMGDLHTHLVMTEPRDGLQPKHVPRALAMLMRPMDASRR